MANGTCVYRIQWNINKAALRTISRKDRNIFILLTPYLSTTVEGEECRMISALFSPGEVAISRSAPGVLVVPTSTAQRPLNALR